MLYLAEVIRKTRVIGSGRAEFKLLALQRSEQSWSPVQGEETIPATDDVPYNAGVLVMLELTANKQIQRYTEAGRQLVGILQNFSRLQEKAKVQEEEIEQWKQSLTYQSQELNRREMEMELRLEELQQLEAELSGMEQQKQEIDSQKEEVDRLKEEFERRSQELEGAWAQLHGEMNRLEERRAELNQSTTLDAGQATYLQELLNRLSTAVAPTDSIREQLNLSFDLIGQQQEQLNHYWQALDQHRSTAHETQAQVDRQAQEIHDRWQGWHQAQADLEQARADLRAKQETLIVRQHYTQTLSQSLQGQEGLHQQLAQLAGTSDKVDLSQLENLPLDNLQNVATDLENDLEKLSRFVSSQEEELSLQQIEIDQLKQQIEQASEYDRLRLETELADEQDRYQMLHETLIGQRRNLQERQTILKQHQMVLARRQGHPVNQEENYAANLEPILQQIAALRQQHIQELADLGTQIQQLQQTIDSDQQTVDQRTQQQQAQREELVQLEQQLKSQMSSVGELWGKVNTYQESLQPIQDRLNGLREKAEAIAAMMTQFQEATDYQHQAIDEMRGAIDGLVNPQVEYAVS